MSKVAIWGAMVAVWATCAASSLAGLLEAPAVPADPNSGMYTLEDIYNRLSTGSTTNPTAFTEPSGGPTNGTMHTLSDIYAIANPTQVAKTGQTNSWYPGDDGWYRTNGVGVAWLNPRFTIGTGGQATNCVTDNLTGLMWARNANLSSNTTWSADWASVKGTCTWFQAFEVITNSLGPVNGATYGGYNDWRMPNVFELQSLVDFGRKSPALCNTAGTGPWSNNYPFANVAPAGIYWSSTKYMSTNNSWTVGVGYDGLKLQKVDTTVLYYVWPVRGGVQ